MLSQTEENYLKAIYSLSFQKKKSVSTNDIAQKLHTKASSVTDMIKKLSEKELVSYKKYQGVNLTSEGENIAIKIVRKHRLWEVFLANKLDFNWDEVHDLAEQLEHIKSDALIEKLDEYLGFPSHDPHGDPIPDKNGIIQQHKNIMLSSVIINKHCKVIGVKDSSSDFLRFLDRHNININTKIKVLEKFDFDDSITIQINNNKNLTVSKKVCSNVYVNII